MDKLHNILINAHRGFAYLEILLVVLFLVALLIVMFGYSGKITKFLKKTSLFTMIFFHIQFLVGLVMLLFTTQAFKGFLEAGTLMKDAYARQTFVEHPFSMLLAAVLMTIANKKIKSNERLPMSAFIMGILAILFFGYAFSLVMGKLFG